MQRQRRSGYVEVECAEFYSLLWEVVITLFCTCRRLSRLMNRLQKIRQLMTRLLVNILLLLMMSV